MVNQTEGLGWQALSDNDLSVDRDRESDKSRTRALQPDFTDVPVEDHILVSEEAVGEPDPEAMERRRAALQMQAGEVELEIQKWRAMVRTASQNEDLEAFQKDAIAYYVGRIRQSEAGLDQLSAPLAQLSGDMDPF